MAKREFIDKDNFWIDLHVQTPISIAMERNTTTEREIIEPYFEKLKADLLERINVLVTIRSSHSPEKLTTVRDIECGGEMFGYREVIKMINNLLSEQGE